MITYVEYATSAVSETDCLYFCNGISSQYVCSGYNEYSYNCVCSSHDDYYPAGHENSVCCFK